MRKSASQIADEVLVKCAQGAPQGGAMTAGIPGATPTMATSAVVPQSIPGGSLTPSAGAPVPKLPATTKPTSLKPPGGAPMKPPQPPKPFSGRTPSFVGTKPAQAPRAGSGPNMSSTGGMPKMSQENTATMEKLAPPKSDPGEKLKSLYPLQKKTQDGRELIVTPRFPFGLSITGTF